MSWSYKRGLIAGTERAVKALSAIWGCVMGALVVCDGGCGGVWAAGAMGVVCAVPRVMKGMYCTVMYCTEVAGSHLRGCGGGQQLTAAACVCVVCGNLVGGGSKR